MGRWVMMEMDRITDTKNRSNVAGEDPQLLLQIAHISPLDAEHHHSKVLI